MNLCLPFLVTIDFRRLKLLLRPSESVDDVELGHLISGTSTPTRSSSPITGYWLGDERGPYVTSEIEGISPSPRKHGGMADIYEARWRSTSRSKASGRVAIKVIRLVNGGAIDKVSKRLSNEVEVWRKLDHSNILPFYGLCSWSGSKLPALVSPWCRNGDINEYLKGAALRGCPILERLRLDLIAQVFTGVQYLHTQLPNVVHADIKGGNVLISDHGVARLCDFGFASIISDDPVNASQHSAVGTWRYMAPEIHDRGEYTTYSDIWACGCFLIEIVGEEFPYYGLNDRAVILAQCRQETPPRPRKISDDLWQLVLRCCEFNPTRRINIGTLLVEVNNLRTLAKTRTSDEPHLRIAVTGALEAANTARSRRDSYSDESVLNYFHTWAPPFLHALNLLRDLRPIVQGVVYAMTCAVQLELSRKSPNRHVRGMLTVMLSIGDGLLRVLCPHAAITIDDSFNIPLHSLMDAVSQELEDFSAMCEAYAQLPYLAQLFTRARWMREFKAFTQIFAERRRTLAVALHFDDDQVPDSLEQDISRVFENLWTSEELKLLAYVEGFGGIHNFLRDQSRFNLIATHLRALNPAFDSDLIVWQDVDALRSSLNEVNMRTLVEHHRPEFERVLSVTHYQLQLEDRAELSEDLADVSVGYDTAMEDGEVDAVDGIDVGNSGNPALRSLEEVNNRGFQFNTPGSHQAEVQGSHRDEIETGAIPHFTSPLMSTPHEAQSDLVKELENDRTAESSSDGGGERLGEALDGDGALDVQLPKNTSQHWQSSTSTHAHTSPPTDQGFGGTGYNNTTTTHTSNPFASHTGSDGDFVAKLNNLYQAAGRSLNSVQRSERLVADVWHAEVIVANVGSFRGTGATRKAARNVAAHAAFTHLGGK